MKGEQKPVNHQLKMFYFQRQRTETVRVNPERPLTQRPRGDLVTLHSRPLARGDPSLLPLPQNLDDETQGKKTDCSLNRAPKLCFTLQVPGFPINQHTGVMSPADKTHSTGYF